MASLTSRRPTTARDFEIPPLDQLAAATKAHADWTLDESFTGEGIRIHPTTEETNVFIARQPDGTSIDVYVPCTEESDPRTEIDGEPVEATTTFTLEDFDADLIEQIEPAPFVTYLEITNEEAGFDWMCGCGTGF